MQSMKERAASPARKSSNIAMGSDSVDPDTDIVRRQQQELADGKLALANERAVFEKQKQEYADKVKGVVKEVWNADPCGVASCVDVVYADLKGEHKNKYVDFMLERLANIKTGISPFGIKRQQTVHTHSPDYPSVRLILDATNARHTSCYCPVTRKRYSMEEVKKLPTYRDALGI